MNEGQSTLQPHFYNPMQDLRSMIHPHLYGLPTNLGSLAHTSDSSSLPSSGGSEIPTSTDPLQTPTSSTWDFLGKMQTGKQNFTDWSVPPQGWLNGGSNSSILSPQLVTPNSNLSAFQHYLNNT
uniref:Uncharacterized protein n=1 Tax=Ciona savignyi TaxID=51511 RepID=H2ZLC3_CIOSA